ncbi:MAG: gamma-glutamyltransferase [Puniceicoccaceae bacterium]
MLSADPIYRPKHIVWSVKGMNGAVVTAEQHATEAGLQVLREGGNALDAAITVGFTLSVTLPRAANIGGGGFLLYHDAGSGQTFALDYREMAPAKAFRDMFLDDEGKADANLSRKSPLAVGVPGTVAGLLEAHRRFGTLPLERLMAPAIALAREGFVISPHFQDLLEKAAGDNRLDETARMVFHGSDGEPRKAGEILIQEDLAQTLASIAEKGKDGFYTGSTAQAIVETLADKGGLITMEDMASYQPVWREPVTGTYKGHAIHSMPPPSSGGVHLVQMLQLLENFPLESWGHNSAQAVHVIAEVMKRAYADRSKYLGDPDFADVPMEQLLSEAHEARVLKQINSISPTPSDLIRPGLPEGPAESTETTHFSIVDKDGNAVANTTTLNFSFGSGIMAWGTGVLLNNEMDDFSAKAGVPNAYGLIGGEFNAVEPGKRPLSSMTPTIVLKDGHVRLVTGSPGGSRIINTALQIILNVLAFDLTIAEATSVPRFHHQWLPDSLIIERTFPSEAIRILKSMGYTIESNYTIGAAQSIYRNEAGEFSAAADSRRPGSTALAY